jgi:hypothetical protein
MKNAIESEAFTAAAKGSTVEIAFIDENATPNFASPRTSLKQVLKQGQTNKQLSYIRQL